jgi:hypothetical protein
LFIYLFFVLINNNNNIHFIISLSIIKSSIKIKKIKTDKIKNVTVITLIIIKYYICKKKIQVFLRYFIQKIFNRKKKKFFFLTTYDIPYFLALSFLLHSWLKYGLLKVCLFSIQFYFLVIKLVIFFPTRLITPILIFKKITLKLCTPLLC